MSFCTTAEVDLGLLQHLRRKKTLLWLHTHAYTQPAITCSKLTIETPERPQAWDRSGVFIVNFEHISHLVLLFLLLTLSR